MGTALSFVYFVVLNKVSRLLPLCDRGRLVNKEISSTAPSSARVLLCVYEKKPATHNIFYARCVRAWCTHTHAYTHHTYIYTQHIHHTYIHTPHRSTYTQHTYSHSTNLCTQHTYIHSTHTYTPQLHTHTDTYIHVV